MLACLITTERFGVLCSPSDPVFWFLTRVTVLFCFPNFSFKLNQGQGGKGSGSGQLSPEIPDTEGLLCKTLTPRSLGLCDW